MKTIALLLLSIACLCSCKKDPASKHKNQFTGTWEYVTFSGYPFNFPSLPPGNGKIIFIGKDGTFERRNHDTITFKGRYFLKERKDCYGDEKHLFFQTTDSLFVQDNTIDVAGDSLYFSSPNCYADGGTSIYRRL